MVKTCCVKNCDIGSLGKITCFRFPNSRHLKRQWIDAIGLSSKLTANSVICIQHFHEHDYDVVRGRPRLKAKVIPSVFKELENRSDDRSPSPITAEESAPETVGDIQTDSLNLSESNKDQNGTRTRSVDASEDSKDKSKNEDGEERSDVINEDRIVNDDEGKEEKDEDQGEKCEDKEEKGEDKEGNNEDGEEKIKNVDGVEKCDSKRPNGIIATSKKRKDQKKQGNQHSLTESVTKATNSVDELDKDIEDIIVNYQIKQTRPVHSIEIGNRLDHDQRLEEKEVEDGEEGAVAAESDPVFIEVSVHGKGDRAGSPRDCLMVLESVQVELDPSAFLTADGEHPDADCHEAVDLDDDDDDNAVDFPKSDNHPDPISLLTSSDEDEVIIQEPHIDTVEVSDETDEDDVPLVKLLKKSEKKRSKVSIWDAFEYFCVDCQYSTTNNVKYKEHVAKHSTILQVCQICDYTSASRAQFARHKRKHKDEKKYKCHICEYKARHNMSLIYHLQSHRALSATKKGFKCDKCPFVSDVKSVVLKHVRLCSVDPRKFQCDKCVYKTKKSSDLKRHKQRRHQQES